MTAPDLTLRVVMITSNVADDIEDGLELSAEPTVILQGGIDAIISAAKMFGEQVTITRAAPSLSAALALPEVAALVEALRKIDVGEGWAAQIARAALAETATTEEGK